MINVLVLSLIGVFVGLAGGMFGIGGSIVLIPAITEYLGPNQHRYQAAAMIVNFFVAVPAVIQHRRAGVIDAGMIARLAMVVVVCVVLGVAISEAGFFADGGEAWLRVLFGGFVLFAAASEIARMLRPKKTAAAGSVGTTPHPRRSWPLLAGVAVPTGFLAGLLGVGGGVLAVPLQRRLLDLPLRVAIANSAVMIVITSTVGAVLKNVAYASEHEGSLDALLLAAIVAPAAVIGSFTGSYLTHVLPIRALRLMFIVLLVIAGAKFTWEALVDLT